MKKKFVIILILSSFSALGQEYSLWYTTRDYQGTSSKTYTVTYTTKDNVQTRNPESKIHPFGVSKLPLKISVNDNLYTSGSFVFLICSFSEFQEVNKYEYLTAGYNSPTIELCIKNMTKTPSELNTYSFFSILLPHYVQPTDTKRSINDLLFKTTQNSFADPIIKVPEIIWKYNYNNKGFVDFPEEIRHNFPMKSTIGEILKNETIEVGKSIKIKAVLDNTNLISFRQPAFNPPVIRLPIISTEIFNFNIISASPELNAIESKETSCFYNSDGSFVLNLKRDLYPNEKLAIIVYEQNILSGNFDIIKTQNLDIKSLEKVSETSYKYEWTKTLSKGTYKVKYQTGEKGTPIDPNDISWSSLIPTDLTIGSPEKVSFSIIGASDQKCFSVNDGYIDVKANGEDGRTYLYQLEKDGVVQFFNGSSWANYTGSNENTETWFAFTSGKNTRVSKLNKGKYKIKVKDSQECFAR
ncbi:hypothetical protein [uncultured Tenacibaculum sp.]|uniref:hypothetical protein n=1 Tax=uncultured Tenacibaculum sp. TaxID=174713 RepID=UPI0026220BA4|nr:hypothetical protein [uncultured Tenacibaculum sp.]